MRLLSARRTTDHTLARRSLQTPAAILRELESRLTCKPDYITLGGSGEPTLYADLGNLIAGIKRLTAIPIAVITNGSLLWQPEVRGELAAADLVSPSLDAGDAETFRRINRPCAGSILMLWHRDWWIFDVNIAEVIGLKFYW